MASATSLTPGRIAALVLAAGWLHLALILPNHPDALTPQALLFFPLELPVLLLALIALPRRGWAARTLVPLVALWLVLGVLLKLADLGTYAALDRRFNPVIDLTLLDAGWRLAVGAIGPVATLASVVAALMAATLIAAAIVWSVRRWAALRLPPLWQGLTASAALVAFGVAALDANRGRLPTAWAAVSDVDPPGAAFTARLWQDRVGLVRRTLTDLAEFRRAASSDPYAGRSGMLAGADGHDILMLFIESYGRTSFDNPLYAPTHTATLRGAEARLDAAGVAMRSGWLTSPISGGQSWLAHATLASGLKIDSQSRYHAMLASPRGTLFHIAAAAGFRTAAVMPAITLAWPEGAVSGFGTILGAKDLGYRGLPFNWVTMPDQFTLTAMERLLRSGNRPAPLFAQIALISSHAPWVPVPEVLDWDEIGDGREFDAMASTGDPPAVVWRDRDRVRDQYRLSIDYALDIVTDYALRQAGSRTLLIVLGDHPPAGFVSQIDSMDVAVHLIGPPDLVARFDDWGWTPGLIPDAATPVWPMESFRDRFLDTLSPDPRAPGSPTSEPGE